MITSTVKLVEPLADYVQQLLMDDAPGERTDQLESAAEFIRQRRAEDRPAPLIFICTHNSRRSHLGHVWADTAARYYNLQHVSCYSGGIETTACNERTVRALRRAGHSVGIATGSAAADSLSNPNYWVQNFEDGPPLLLYSKIYSEGNGHIKDYAAMMCCSDVDARCPTVADAAIRIPLHYDDPKEADDTPLEAQRYDERCWQIGRDMFRLMQMASA